MLSFDDVGVGCWLFFTPAEWQFQRPHSNIFFTRYGTPVEFFEGSSFLCVRHRRPGEHQ